MQKFEILYGRGNVRSGKFLSGEIFSRGSLRGSVQSGNCPLGEVSVGEVSVGDLSLGKCQSGNCLVGKLSYNPCNKFDKNFVNIDTKKLCFLSGVKKETPLFLLKQVKQV